MKRLKRLAALALSAVMAVGMMIPAGAMRIQHNITGGKNPSQIGYGSVGSITVMDVPENTTLTAYRLFDMPADDAFTLFATSPWYQFFSSGEGSNYVDLEEIELEYSDGTKETAYLVEAKANFTDKTAQTLAQAAKNYLAGISLDADTTVALTFMSEADSRVDTSGVTASSTGYIAQAAPVLYGYYLIDTEMGSLCSVTSANPDAFVYDKSTRPSVFKEVWTGDGLLDPTSDYGWSSSNDATIGDTVWFRITLNPATALSGGSSGGGDGPVDDGKRYTVTYTDGVSGETVFADQIYTNLKAGDSISKLAAFVGDPNQYPGYTFQGWSPAVKETVDPAMADEDGNIVYTATWQEIVTYTVTYTDGVGGQVFGDEKHENLKANDVTPSFNGSTSRVGYIFTGWTPAIAATVSGNATYTAQWRAETSGNNTDTAEAAENYSAASYSASSYALNQSGSVDSYNSQLPANYALILSDTMDSGLTFNGSSVQAYLVTDGTYHPLTVDGVTESEGITIGYTGYQNRFQIGVAGTASKDSQIVIVYSAKLGNNAVVGTGGNENTVELLQGGSRVGSASTVTYTYAFDLVKIDGDNQVLDGAKFQLYSADNERFPLTVRKVSDSVYRVIFSDVTLLGRGIVNPNLSAPIEAGNVTIEGLGSGTYILREVQAPSGYNKAQPQEFTIVNNKTITVGGSQVSSTATVQNGVYQEGGLAIVNLRGIELPHTGGMGTTLFYVVGGVLVVGAGILLIVKKRMKNEE